MVIGFKKQFPWKAPTNFQQKILVSRAHKGIAILAGIKPKIHTIRIDSLRRWKVGMTMHMAHGVRTKNYHCFCKQTLKRIQTINIIHFDGKTYCKHWVDIWVDGKLLSPLMVKKLAINDGFDSIADFFKWFDKDFDGVILHWTNRKY